MKENASVLQIVIKKTNITISTGVALQQSLLVVKITYSIRKIQGRRKCANIYYAGKKIHHSIV